MRLPRRVRSSDSVIECCIVASGGAVRKSRENFLCQPSANPGQRLFLWAGGILGFVRLASHDHQCGRRHLTHLAIFHVPCRGVGNLDPGESFVSVHGKIERRVQGHVFELFLLFRGLLRLVRLCWARWIGWVWRQLGRHWVRGIIVVSPSASPVSGFEFSQGGQDERQQKPGPEERVDFHAIRIPLPAKFSNACHGARVFLRAQ